MKNSQGYKEYQHSGEEWLGSLPKDWKVIKTKNLFNLITQPAPIGNKEELLSVYTALGVRPRKELEERGNKASTTDNYWLVKKGDIIVNKLLAWMGAIGISNYDGVTSPAYDILRAKEGVNAFYYNYLFRTPFASREFKRHSRGIMDMRLRLYFNRFGDIKLPSPSLEEQTQIVRFIDYKLSKIDRFIRKKKQLIKHIYEQKSAIINHYVTKGLEPKASQKYSGLEWLGEIPKHWHVKPLKYFVTCNDEVLPNNTHDDYKIRYIDIGNVNASGEIFEIVEYRFGDAPSRARRIVRENDIIVSTVRTYLKAITRITGDTENLIVSTGFAVLRPNNDVSGEYLNYAIRANYFIETICSRSYGVSYPAINATELVRLKIALPPFEEQVKIVERINLETELLNTTISKINNEVALTLEYRNALITEAVTGKVDLREYKIPVFEAEEYEELEEEMSLAAEEQGNYETE